MGSGTAQSCSFCSCPDRLILSGMKTRRHSRMESQLDHQDLLKCGTVEADLENVDSVYLPACHATKTFLPTTEERRQSASAARRAGRKNPLTCQWLQRSSVWKSLSRKSKP